MIKSLQELSTQVFTVGVRRFLILLLILGCIVIPMMAVQVFIDIRTFQLSLHDEDISQQRFYQGTPLHDEILDNLPDVNVRLFGISLSDIFLNSFIGISIIYFLMHPVARQDRTLLLRRTVALVGVAYFLRIFTILFTRLPGSVKNCKVDDFKGISFLQRMFNISESCTDMIYSGHTCMAMVLLWSWLSNSAPHITAKIYASLHVFTAIIFFFFNRLHYTVDITLGIYISFFLTTIYSLCLRIIEHNDQLHHSIKPSEALKPSKEFVITKSIRWIELRNRNLVALENEMELHELEFSSQHSTPKLESVKEDKSE